MRTVIVILATIFIFLALDLTWITWIIKKLYASHFGSLIRQPYPRVGASLAAYFCIFVGILWFGVMGGEGQPLKALGCGALFGFCSYGIYAFTNLAVFEPWTLKIACYEVLGGAVNCGLTSLLATLIAYRGIKV